MTDTISKFIQDNLDKPEYVTWGRNGEYTVHAKRLPQALKALEIAIAYIDQQDKETSFMTGDPIKGRATMHHTPTGAAQTLTEIEELLNDTRTL